MSAPEAIGGGFPSALRRLARCVAAMLVVCAAAGCVHYEAAPIEPKGSAESFAARQLTDPRLREEVGRILPQGIAEWPPGPWDRAQLLAVALVRNPTLEVARAQAQAVLAREITAAQRPNPELTLQSEYARHDASAWLYGVSLNWLLVGERRLLEIAAARIDSLNAQLQLTDQAWAVRRELSAALSDWEGARRRLALLDRLAQLEDRLLDLERMRVAGGEDSPGELIAGERDRIEVEQQQSQQRAAADAAQSAVARAIGFPPQALDGVAFAWPDWGEPPSLADADLGAAREQALLSRTDLRIAIGDYSAAENRLRLAVARQYPQLVLQPGYYWDHGIAKFPFDLSFELPVNRNRGEIAEARAGRELAGERMLALQADIYGEISEAQRAEAIARTGADVAERQLQTARRQEQQSELALKVGAMDSLERIGAQIVAVRAELELLQIRERLQASRNSLEDVLRAPLSGPELALAKSLAASAGGI